MRAGSINLQKIFEQAIRYGQNCDSLLRTIGNLTLLTSTLNPSVSNSGWETKRPEFLKHSKLNMNRYFQLHAEWDEERIQTLSEELFGLLKQVWPHLGDVESKPKER